MKNITVEEAIEVLKSKGYFVENLYSDNDVTNRFKCSSEQAIGVLRTAFNGEWLGGEINQSIRIVAREMGYEEIFTQCDKNGTDIEVGCIVDVDAPTEGAMYNFDFQGTVKVIGEDYVTVEDQEGDCFDIEPCNLEVVNE